MALEFKLADIAQAAGVPAAEVREFAESELSGHRALYDSRSESFSNSGRIVIEERFPAQSSEQPVDGRW